MKTMPRALIVLSLTLQAVCAFAQFTTVTGTVTDPNGLPYAFGTIAPTLVTSSTPTVTATGALYLAPNQATGLDTSGKFTVRLGDNSLLSPAGTKWNFVVCSAQGTVQFSWGLGSVCFSLAAPITISGASQDISQQLNAVAPALTHTMSTSGISGGVLNTGTIGRFSTVYAAQGNDFTTGAAQNAPNTLGTRAVVNVTGSDGQGTSHSAVAAGSTATVIGMSQGSTAGTNAYGFGAFYRLSHRFLIGNTTNVRYWQGVTSNQGNFLGSGTLFAVDNPNTSNLAFRFSAGTDTHWMAYASTSNVAFTAVDTGVTPDTVNPHLFEIVPNATLTSVGYYIDSVLVATITTNLPAGTTDLQMFWTGDNKNTATAISANFYWMSLLQK